MKKNSAWTFVELMVCVSIIFVITASLFSVYKPSTQKSKIYLYASLKNIIKGNIGVLEKYEGNLFYQDESDTVYSTYCKTLADMFSLSKGTNCALNSTNDTTNLSISNGAELRGIASAPKTPFEGAGYTYKNILLDIDGFDTGLNRIWIDRFPLRIYAGGNYDGNIQPINCANDSVYDNDGNIVVLSDSLKSPYCGKSINYTNDNSLLSYDIVGLDDNAESEELAKGSVIASNLSPLQADCLAYGGKGFYHAKQCAQAGYKIHTKCATSENCETCASVSPSICPLNNSGVQTTNAEECNAINNGHKKCVAYIHKPSGGMNVILETLIGDLGDI